MAAKLPKLPGVVCVFFNIFIAFVSTFPFLIGAPKRVVSHKRFLRILREGGGVGSRRSRLFR